MTTLTVEGGARLAGRVIAPPDKSIFHRAAMFALLGRGASTITPHTLGADNHSTLAAIAALGANVEIDIGAPPAGRVIVRGVGGPQGIVAPSEPIDCGNSGTTMRLLAGLLAGVPGRFELTGDDSLCGRPMSRLRPLVDMGAGLSGRDVDGKIYPPIVVEGRALAGADISLNIASAQVKSAVLMAGLFAKGQTRVTEPARSRDHTERMFRMLGVDLREEASGTLVLNPLDSPWDNVDFEVAPDLSSAAFILGAALVTGSEDVRVQTHLNPTRAGFIEALEAFGAKVHRSDEIEMGAEPVADVSVSGRGLRGATIEGALTLRAIDEIPLLAAIAAFADGMTHIRDAGELRVKESDRLAETAKLLRAFGAKVEEHEDGLSIQGAPGGLRPAEVSGGLDHRIALTAAVLGLGIEGCTRVHGADIIDVSFPSFASDLAQLGAKVS